MKAKLALSLLCLLTLLPIAQATLVDDRYHFADYQNSPAVADYGEWWYFALSQGDVQAMFQYGLWDPANLTENHMALMLVELVVNGTQAEYAYPIPWEYVVTSDTSANLTMGPNTIAVADGIYTIQGVAFNQLGEPKVAWNLHYVPDKPSLDGYRNLKLSRSDPSQEMNWYVQIPSAAVYGVIVADGIPISVNGRGYHDHNWGTWKLYLGLWNWFQTNNADISIVGYDHYTIREGTINIFLNGEHITFRRNQYFLINYDWTFSPEASQYYPRKTKVLAFNGRYFLNLNILVDRTGIIGRVYPNGLVWLVFESTAYFTGKLYGHRTTTTINTLGFKEYTTKTTIIPVA